MNAAEAPDKVESGSSFEGWRYRSSTMRLDWSRRGFIALTLVGHGHAAFAAPCLRRWNDALRMSERLTVLCDFWDMPTYDSALRLALTDWSVQNRGRLEPIHLLTRSQLVRMGVAVANLALGGLITTYALRASYDVAVRQLGAATRPPRR